jgi:hypothetical protein
VQGRVAQATFDFAVQLNDYADKVEEQIMSRFT